MILVITYFALFVVNGLIIYLANLLFPAQVVLGTMSIGLLWAILHTAGVLTLIDTLAIPFFHEKEKMMKRMLSPKEWMIGYFVLNFVAVWSITRFSEEFGMGVVSWMVVLVLALVLDFVQGMAMMWVQKMYK